jgi:multiple sugar transport system ATP-binding protein
MARIQLKDVWKRFGNTEAVRGINLDIAHNEFVVLVGPSGCGKSTLLRMVAGLEDITSGKIYIDDKLINYVAPRDRHIAMVFQNYALYPHMTVSENMSFGLRLAKTPREEIQRRVQEAAEILHIKELLDRRPKQLSGGQQQRVAMGRAIVRNPQAFLFDEPLSNLDAKMRVQMRTEIKKIHQRVQTTVIYVTHDQVEAMTLADRIIIMNEGKIEQIASPQEMYDRPATQFVAGFIGSPSMNFISCKLTTEQLATYVDVGDGLKLKVPDERASEYQAFLGKLLTFGIRPEHVTEKRAHTTTTQVDFSADVEVVEPMGMDTMVFFNMNSEDVCARSVPHSVMDPGHRMEFTVDMNRMHLIDPETGRVI